MRLVMDAEDRDQQYQDERLAPVLQMVAAVERALEIADAEDERMKAAASQGAGQQERQQQQPSQRSAGARRLHSRGERAVASSSTRPVSGSGTRQQPPRRAGSNNQDRAHEQTQGNQD